MARLRSVRMVGRDDELSLLRSLAVGAAARRPAVAVVLGEAGIGKSRLVEELAGSLSRTMVLRGGCAPGPARGVPLGPVSELLRDLERGAGPPLDRYAPGTASALAALVPDLVASDQLGSGQHEWSSAELFDAVGRVIRGVGRARPVLVVVEDVHWADETTLELLEFLARSLRDEQVLLVLTARTDDPAFEQCRATLATLMGLSRNVGLDLTRLGADEVASQVRSLHGQDEVTETTVSRIVEIADGVPLLVEELVDADLDDVGRIADLLLGHRLDRLSPSAWTVVATTAVAQFDVSADDLARAAPVSHDDFDAAFGESIAAGVLVRRGAAVRFRHALLREAAVARVMPNAERELHRRWSQVLGPRPRGRTELVAAAHHREHGGDLRGALEAYLEAAAAARFLSAHVEEIKLLERAASLWHQVPDAGTHTGTTLTDVYAAAAWASHLRMAEPQDGMRLADAAIASLPDDATPHRRAMLNLLWHRTRWAEPDHLTTEEVLAVVDDVTMDPPSEEAVLACLEATDALVPTGDLGRAEDYVRRAVALATQLRDPALEARAHTLLAAVLVRSGRDVEAQRAATRAVTLGERSGSYFVRLEGLMALQLVQRNLATGTQELDDRIVELLGGDRPGPLPGRWAIAQAARAESLVDAGRWADAQAALDLVLAEPMPDWVAAEARRLRDHLAVWRGVTPAPEVGSARGPAPSLDTTDLDALVATAYTEADLLSRRGDVTGSRSRTTPLLRDDRVVTSRAYFYQLLWIAARTEAETVSAGGDAAPHDGEWTVERVRSLLDSAPPACPRDRAYAGHVRADLDRRTGSDDAATWAGVVAGWREAGLPFLLATSLVRAGATAAAEGRPEEARAALREADEIGERLGARPLVEEVAAVARQAHLRLRTGGSAAPSELGLSPRELDVLRLLAEGATNSSIATSLFISPKTASVHVSHILAKLGVANRGEAGAVAHRAGITTSRTS